MDIRSARLRLVVAGLAATLVIGFASVASPAYAMRAAGTMRAQCDPTVALSVEATAAYDSAYGRFLDGIISNDSTVTVESPVVQIGWAEDAERVDYVWPRGDALEPGQWTAFHLCWPDDVPAGWTPIVSAGGHQTDRTSLRLRVDAISEAAVNDETGMRSYVATVTNDAAFPVSSIELVGVEWDGDTFVVESNGFRDGGWLDTRKGHPHSSALRLTERFRRLDIGRLEVSMTIDDPRAYAKPWTARTVMTLLPDTELLEAFCDGHEKTMEHRRVAPPAAEPPSPPGPR